MKVKIATNFFFSPLLLPLAQQEYLANGVVDSARIVVEKKMMKSLLITTLRATQPIISKRNR